MGRSSTFVPIIRAGDIQGILGTLVRGHREPCSFKADGFKNAVHLLQGNVPEKIHPMTFHEQLGVSPGGHVQGPKKRQ